jgi:hypothetical protein
MSWTYFKPEDHGLVGVGTVDWLGNTGDYDWDTTTVMYHPETDRFYWERGSGCSCNGPLEDVGGLDDLESGTLWELTSELSRGLASIGDHPSLMPTVWEKISGDIVDLLSAGLKAREARG